MDQQLTRPAPLTGAAPVLPDIVALHGRWQGSKPALVTETETLSWSDLSGNVNAVANALAASGAGPGASVAVAMQNGRGMVETLLGAARAGCVSAPLNLSITDEAMAGMIVDADARIIVATPDQVDRIDRIRAGLRHPPVCILAEATGDLPEGWISYEMWRDAQPVTAPDVSLSPDDPLNIIYSSGTTGQPKGIVHTHRTRLDWAYDLALALRYHSGCRTLCTLGLYSNISWVMLLCTFLVGGTLHVSRRFDAGSTLDAIAQHRITHSAMVPVQFQRLMDHPEMSREALASLQAIMSCGSALPGALKARIFDLTPCGVIELYGLTEGVITTLAPEDAEGRLASVGRPIQGTDIRIINENGDPCATGEAGEIVATGRIVMPGYLNRPDATREASWTSPDGRIWLRTGDIGNLDADGFLYIVDRKKDMIISGGQNIFPADIERVAVDHPGIAAVAVIGVPDADWGETPVAFVETAPRKSIDAVEARDWINERVGKRQRVRDVIVIAELPRNPNGKVLKRELRARLADAETYTESAL